MSNAIVTTTINPPTEALEKFAKTGWHMIIVGDMKTPHDKYKQFKKKYPNVEYMSPEKQDKLYRKISDNIGWNCIQRRAVGIAHAYLSGFDIVALVDDDNIPLDTWGKNLYVGKEIEVKTYFTDIPVFDPLFAMGFPYFWHRGFPIQLLEKRAFREMTPFTSHEEITTKVSVEVQADLWNGAPDIDAVARIVHPEPVEFFLHKPFSSNALCPFNSQNTFLSRKALEYYYLFPHIGRMDDIWGSYVLQEYLPNCVIYAPPSVYQKRNKHDIVKDMKDEMYGYENTIKLVNDLYYWTKYIPEKTQEFVRLYTETIHGSV